MNILSLQSEVVYGHVGQGAARFALQRLGHEVWAIPTVILSSHAGHAMVEGEAVSPEAMRRLVGGLASNGWLEQCDAVISGYLGSAAQAEIVRGAVRCVKDSNPAALYVLDPVFGDDGRAYAKPGVAEAMARTLLPLADIVTPNAFELSSLAGVAVRDVTDALVAAKRLARPLVVATSVPAAADRIGALAAGAKDAWFASTPRLDNVPRGAGDLFAALFLSARLEGHDLQPCLERTTSSVFHVLEKSIAAHSSEMLLIQEQNCLLQLSVRGEVRLEQISPGKGY
ncbi:MAG TPA: pyridoxal kinase [Rhizomicrobium sp.]